MNLGTSTGCSVVGIAILLSVVACSPNNSQNGFAERFRMGTLAGVDLVQWRNAPAENKRATIEGLLAESLWVSNLGTERDYTLMTDKAEKLVELLDSIAENTDVLERLGERPPFKSIREIVAEILEGDERLEVNRFGPLVQ